MQQDEDNPGSSRVQRALQMAKERGGSVSAARPIPLQRRHEDDVSRNARKPIGEMLVERGKISEADRERIVEYAESKNLQFGDAAIKLNLLSRADLHHAVAEQFDYPFLAKGAGGHSPKLVAAYSPFSRRGEKYRNLHSQILLNWDMRRSRSLAILCPGRDNEGSVVAANLAVVFSQSGTQTLLVDTNLKSGNQTEFFNVSNQRGLSALLLQRATMEEAIQELDDFRSLSLLPAGPPPPNAGDLISRQQQPSFVSELQRIYEIVIVDAAGYRSNAGAELIARLCGSALLVLQKNRTYMADAERLLASLREGGVQVVGSVIAD